MISFSCDCFCKSFLNVALFYYLNEATKGSFVKLPVKSENNVFKNSIDI